IMSAAHDRPNVLILMSDQHSKFHLGCYGDPVVRTPHLDRLAVEGMRFDSAYCASPLCVPSRMAFMTSRHPSSIRVWKNEHILSSAIPTWAHALGAAGYETALIGRMHFVGSDQRHGFEKRPLGEYSALHPGAPETGAARFIQMPGTTSGQCRESVEIAGYGRTSYQAFDEDVAAATCAYLRERAAESGARPFAAVGGFVLPHCPFFAPRDLFEYYYDRVDVPELTAEQLAREPRPVRRFREQRGIAEPLTREQIRVARAAYFALCEYFDRQIGRVLATLDETGLAQNTLVIYCSDHGEMAGEHGCWWKSNYFEGSVGVPLLARLPGTIDAGTSNAHICNLIDLGPTLCELAGADIPGGMEGRSLWPGLTGATADAHANETFSEHFGTNRERPSRMIRSGPWKLYHYHGDDHPVLYNLHDDPGEWHDLAADPAHAGRRAELMTRLYADWDPERVLQESAVLDRDYTTIRRWGAALNPPHPDNLPVPDAEDITRV
ncbi:MAG: sulfatase-like hydrolase/transferase, partial [Cephaloticoccus sp.]|nr:sulfatase-like hydrolase/transferase [Cephaloticoccus sp.]